MVREFIYGAVEWLKEEEISKTMLLDANIIAMKTSWNINEII